MLLRLSRLSKALSINVRYTAPGHANPYFLDRAHFIDPSHPAANTALRNLPSFVCPQFTIRAFPNEILQEPVDFVPINPLLATGLVRARTHPAKRQRWWSKLDIDDTQHCPDAGTNRKRTTWTTFHEKEGHRRWDNVDAMKRHIKFVAARQVADARVAALAKSGRRNVSLLFHTSKKATSKSSVIRRRLRSKMTAAIGLVVARSADTVDALESDQPRPLNIVSRPLQDNERLVLQDWTYLVVPDLAIYKTPLPNLVSAVRKALLTLSHQSKRLESSWKSKSRSSIHSPLHRPPSNMIRTRIDHPHRPKPLPRTSERAQGSDSPREPAKHESVSTRLYSSRPIILSEVKK